MARRKLFFSLAPHLKEKKIGVILVQINEAHSNKWPIGLEHHPEVQKNFEERVERAQEFTKDYDVPYDVYVDDWQDEFELKFRAWPDKYYFIDKNKMVLNKSEYGTKNDQDGVIEEDYTVLLQKYLQKHLQNI